MPEYEASDLLPEPVLVLDASGCVRQSNRAARRVFGALLPGTSFASRVPQPETLADLLRRFSSSSEPSFGTIEVRSAEGLENFRVTGARLSGVGQAAAVGLRFTLTPSSEFTELSAQVKALNSEIRQHRFARRKLSEALDANQVLYRELQHRVKNHLQIVMAMFGIARRQVTTDREHRLLDIFERRVGAVSEVQLLMYAVRSMSGVPAAELIEAIVRNFRKLADASATIRVDAVSDELTNEYATPFALILNELLSNAVKYGGVDGRLEIEICFRGADGNFELVVQDRGPGFAVNSMPMRGTGLGLVHGLCRQIRAEFNIETSTGVRCSIRFQQPTGKPSVDGGSATPFSDSAPQMARDGRG